LTKYSVTAHSTVLAAICSLAGSLDLLRRGVSAHRAILERRFLSEAANHPDTICVGHTDSMALTCPELEACVKMLTSLKSRILTRLRGTYGDVVVSQGNMMASKDSEHTREQSKLSLDEKTHGSIPSNNACCGSNSRTIETNEAYENQAHGHARKRT
jgi:hypothetical protein